MKNNKQGFTLIELISVIGILVSVAMMTLPSVAQMIKDVKEAEYKDLEKQIQEAAEMYLQHNRKDMHIASAEDEESKIKYLKIQLLLDDNRLQAPLLDPRNNTNLKDGCIMIRYDEENFYVFNVMTNCKHFEEEMFNIFSIPDEEVPEEEAEE